MQKNCKNVKTRWEKGSEKALALAVDLRHTFNDKMHKGC